MRELCINCGVLFGPGLASLALIVWGLSSKILDWDDLGDRKIVIVEIGIVVLALSLVWMFALVFQYEEINYLRLFGPGFVGLGITGIGVYRMRHDVNFTGLDRAYTGIILYSGSLFWIFWVFQAFS